MTKKAIMPIKSPPKMTLRAEFSLSASRPANEANHCRPCSLKSRKPSTISMAAVSSQQSLIRLRKACLKLFFKKYTYIATVIIRQTAQAIRLKSKARLFAGKVNAKVPVVFYVPSEAYFVYRLAQDAFAWSIDLTVNGSPIKLSKNNYKKLLSKEISSSNNVVKVLENYNKLVSKAASANEGVLLPLPDCPSMATIFGLPVLVSLAIRINKGNSRA